MSEELNPNSTKPPEDKASYGKAIAGELTAGTTATDASLPIIRFVPTSKLEGQIHFRYTPRPPRSDPQSNSTK